MKNRIIFIAIIGALFVSNVYFILKANSLGGDLANAKKDISSFNRNSKIISFSRLFVDNVLKAGKEVNLNTRLKLENAVRDIKDDEILAQWDKFTKSQTESEAQNEVKNLLDLLMKKIQ